jgi:D-alanyl-D-alanine carboxypeptidase (penicillin-binding protein 5/6)
MSICTAFQHRVMRGALSIGLLAASMTLASPAASLAPHTDPAPVAATPNVPPPAVAAKSWLVVDVSGSQILASELPDERVDPASLTKVMTAYLSFQALVQGSIRLEDSITPSVKAWKTEGSRMFIDPKHPVTVDELLHGMIIQSGNDATVALAEKVGGTEEIFVELMNRKAAEFGMKGTQFRNASGLPDPNHYSTARDLATLAQRLVTDFPQYLPLYSIRDYTFNKIKQPNRNRLLWMDPTVDGLKTGHTEAAGFCLIATAKRTLPAITTSAGTTAGGERRVLSVVLGTASDALRATESQKLLNWAFQNFDTVRLVDKRNPVQIIPLFKGEKKELATGVADDVYATVPRGMADRIKASVERNDKLVAPIAVGQKVGTIRLTLDGQLIREVPLVALESVDQAGVFGRAIDTIRLWFN